MRPLAHRLALAAAALLAAGCATSRQCTIPESPLAPPPGPPIHARVGVAYPDGLEVDSLPVQSGSSGFRFPTGPAAVAALNQAAAQLFERPVPAVRPSPVPGGPEAVLSFTLDRAWTSPGAFGPESAAVRITGVLRDARGEVARSTATGRGEAQGQGFGSVHCEATGRALAGAIAAAAARVRDELGASPALAAWVRDPARAPWPPAAEDAALTAPAQPPPGEGERWRQGIVPRFIELDLAFGGGAASGPYGVGLGGPGFGLRLAWDVGPYVALGLQVAGAYGSAGPPPGSGLPSGRTSLGLVGLEGLVRLRPGQPVRPWLGLTGGVGTANWAGDEVSGTDLTLAGSAGVDFKTGEWGWLRLGLTYAGWGTTLVSGWDGQGSPPPSGIDGSRARVHGLWVTLGWVLDLGPAR